MQHIFGLIYLYMFTVVDKMYNTMFVVLDLYYLMTQIYSPNMFRYTYT